MKVQYIQLLSYSLEFPGASIKIYHGEYEGLMRAEFEFNNLEEAKAFHVPEWAGQEITNSTLGRDARLSSLNRDRFRQLLHQTH